MAIGQTASSYFVKSLELEVVRDARNDWQDVYLEDLYVYALRYIA